MRYTFQAIKYVLRNILYLLPLVAIPAFCLALSTDQEAIVCSMETLQSGIPSDFHFKHIFGSMSILSFTSVESIIFGLLGIISLVFFVSLIMAMIEKHMRIGKRTFNGVFSKLNDNLLPTLGYLLLLLAIYEIWALLVSTFLFLASNIPHVIVAYIVMAIVFLSAHLLLLYTISLIYLWLPCMQITGFKSMEALYYSNRLSASVKWKISFNQLLSFVAVEVIMVLCVILTPSETVFFLLTTASYAFVIMIYCVRMEIMYFELDNIGRADVTKYYQR